MLPRLEQLFIRPALITALHALKRLPCVNIVTVIIIKIFEKLGIELYIALRIKSSRWTIRRCHFDVMSKISALLINLCISYVTSNL